MHAGDLKLELSRLFSLALPLAAAEAGTQVMSVVDMAVIGRLGGRELAATGLANAVFFGVSVFGMGLMLGVDPLISQAVGASELVRARRNLWQGVWLGLITAGCLTAVLLGGPLLLQVLGVQPELVAPATSYLLIRLIGLSPWLLFFVVRAYLQAHHATRPMVVSMIVANVLNVGGDIVLVFGGHTLPEWSGVLRGIPPLGVAGAAISTVVCQLVQLAIVAAAVVRIPIPHGVAFSRRWIGADVRRAVRVGLPTAFQVTAEVGIFVLVALLAGRMGTVDLAAHQLVITLASFTFTVALGVATAGSVRVGLAVGARDQERVRVAGYATFIAAAMVMSVGATLFITVPSLLARMVTDQPGVIAASLPLFFVAGLFQLSDGLQAAGIGALRGAADTRFAFFSNLIGYWLIALPLALFLGLRLHMGVVGFWWSFVAGLTTVAILVFFRFRTLSSKEITPLAEMAT
ncbi:MAG TPA: MATE family efflux transporter [Thermoanaerobaculia bacterium]|nr:MATE family efflux transporter [Thermoanaerobaculia bacterium]